MNLLELFSGIGGFSLGLQQAGFTFDKVYFSEIDRHAIANFKHNFPNAQHVGSVCDITGASIERPDIITFGSPCQNFSVAGNGLGLQGSESSLIRYAIEAIDYFRPDIFIWENVKGVLCERHCRDFWAIVKALADIGVYQIEWQLLNTSWVLPQNRERIYLVGRLAEKCRDKVFPVCESVFASEKKAEDGPEDKDCCGTLVKTYGQSSNWITYVLQLQRGEQFNGTLEAIHEGRLRLLTETECERLQGFPDDFTRYGVYDGDVREISRTQRYSLLGNAVSPPIVERVAARIKQTTLL